MELLSISEIRHLSDRGIEDYISILEENIPSGYPWDISSIRSIVNVLHRFPLNLITEDAVMDYIESYMIENVNSIDISSTTIPFIFSDQSLRIIKWVNDDKTHYTVLTEEKLASLIVNIGELRDFNSLPDNFRTRAELEIGIQTRNIRDTIFEYFMYLDLISEEEFNTIIPVPSSTHIIDETTERFSSALWFDEIRKRTVLLAGLGGIGSYIAFLLSRMHPNSVFMYDDDIVEAVNLAGQMFGSSDIGKYKVDAMAERIIEMSSYSSLYCIRDRYTAETQASDIMICGFDNMEARKVFFNNWLNHVNHKEYENRKDCLFIDGRLAAEEFQVFCIRGDYNYNIDKYQNDYLFSDEEADETLCSYKQTSYMANMIGSIIINLFTNFVANSIQDNIRELPFLTTYDGSTMTFKTRL